MNTFNIIWNRNGVTKTFQVQNYEDLFDQIKQNTTTTMPTPTSTPTPMYTVVQKNSPWAPLPTDFKQLQNDLVVIPLINQSNGDGDNNNKSTEFNHLEHFLSQPEGKIEFILKNNDYAGKLHEKIDHLLNTFNSKEDENNVNKLVKHLYYLLVNTKPTTEQQNLYWQWTIKMATQTSIAAPETTKYIKILLQQIFNHTLEK